MPAHWRNPCPLERGRGRFLALLSVLALLVGALASPAASQSRQGDAAGQFSLVVPAGWSTGAHPDHPKAALAMSQGQNSLGVYPFQGKSMDRVVGDFDRAYGKAGARKTFERTTTVNEVPAHLTVWETPGEAAFTAVLVAGQKGFILLGYVKGAGQEATARQMLDIITSFRIGAGGAAPAARPPSPEGKRPAPQSPASKPPEDTF